MLNAEEQIEVLALVSNTKNLILSEQEKAEVTVKGAADKCRRGGAGVPEAGAVRAFPGCADAGRGAGEYRICEGRKILDP